MDKRVIPITEMSGWRIMWMLVMFDLPVVDKNERKAACKFREGLLDLGFEMAQFSVYMRCCVTRERCESLTFKIKDMLPKGGRVDILYFTDKQYGQMRHFFGSCEVKPLKNESQLALF